MSDQSMFETVGPIWKELSSGLWHMTHPQRFLGILEDEAILCEPERVDNSERFKANHGPELYPYVRHIGGVSLFDFSDFEPTRYTDRYPLSSWHEFLPYRRKWGGAVWIELDSERVGGNLISGQTLLEEWRRGNNARHTIMPLIECAHIGDVALSSLVRALLIFGVDGKYHVLTLEAFCEREYSALLVAWRSFFETTVYAESTSPGPEVTRKMEYQNRLHYNRYEVSK